MALFRRQQATRSLPALAAAVFAALLLPPMQASALPDDTEQPIHITTDEALRDEKTGRTVYQGNVELVQGTIKITADRITFYQTENEAGRIVAEGSPARMQQQPEIDSPLMHAHGDIIEYFRSEERVQLRENAQVEQDGSTVQGDLIDYFINQQLVKAAAETSNNSRVVVVIPAHKLEEEDE
ncbi:MAG: lipopolysaccharide transport periplasmic protein LptA [Halieaceae bacterium]|nr:lipopolysaccharide transport periplasmic protein LptA [Halieaceae bacterium]